MAEITELVILSDKSISMQEHAAAAQSGIQSFITGWEASSDDVSVTWVEFDTVQTLQLSGVGIELTDSSGYTVVVGSGFTAFNDAVTDTINMAKSRFVTVNPDNVHFLISTDAGDNKSLVYSEEEMKDLISIQASSGWQFHYTVVDATGYSQTIPRYIAAKYTTGIELHNLIQEVEITKSQNTEIITKVIESGQTLFTALSGMRIL